MTILDANIVALEFWKDPPSDVILIYGEWGCSVYFRCWSSAGIPADYHGHLSFDGAQAVGSFLANFFPAKSGSPVAPTSSKLRTLTLPEITWIIESCTIHNIRCRKRRTMWLQVMTFTTRSSPPRSPLLGFRRFKSPMRDC